MEYQTMTCHSNELRCEHLESIHLFDYPELDYKATKREVMKVIGRYKNALNKLYLKSEPRITPQYTIVPPSFTNEFHSSTEDAALWGDTEGKKFKDYVERVNTALNSIPSVNRVVIYRSLIKEQSDVLIGSEMNYSEFTIRDIRMEGIRLLAYALGVDVYQDGTSEGVEYD